MTSKPVVLLVPITELLTLVERKSKQMVLNYKPEPMALPNNDLSLSKSHFLSLDNMASAVATLSVHADAKISDKPMWSIMKQAFWLQAILKD